MKKAIAAIAVSAALAGSLSACSESKAEREKVTNTGTTEGFDESHNRLASGLVVTCLSAPHVGMSCDWANAR